jgi:hypothetical protein
MSPARIFLAILALIATPTLSHAGSDALTGSLNKRQLQAIQMMVIAKFAGEHDHCPGYHVIENALFQELADGGVRPEMIGTREYGNAVIRAARRLQAAGPRLDHQDGPEESGHFAYQHILRALPMV